VDTNDISDIKPAEQFLTSFGLIDTPNTSNITTDLADRAFIHALTAQAQAQSYTTTSETDPFVYLATDRYTQEAFYGMIIDTSVSKRSIVGYS
jgi:hypothetical protein